MELPDIEDRIAYAMRVQAGVQSSKPCEYMSLIIRMSHKFTIIIIINIIIIIIKAVTSSRVSSSHPHHTINVTSGEFSATAMIAAERHPLKNKMAVSWGLRVGT